MGVRSSTRAQLVANVWNNVLPIPMATMTATSHRTLAPTRFNFRAARQAAPAARKNATFEMALSGSAPRPAWVRSQYSISVSMGDASVTASDRARDGGIIGSVPTRRQPRRVETAPAAGGRGEESANARDILTQLFTERTRVDYVVAVLLPQLLHGLVLGAALGLLALGLTVIFGLLGVMNFAHGELYMMGAYAGVGVIALTHSFWLALVVAPLVVGIIGAVTEMATLRPLYRREPLYGLILTFGLALAFREAVRQLFGGDMRRVLPPISGSIPLLGMTYPNYRLFLLAMASLLLLAIWLFFTRTRAGILVRAAVQDAEMLDGLGVNVPRVFTLTFAGSAALAALAGLLLAPVFTVYPQMGVEMILLAFIVVILGGMGSMGGSVIAAFFFGVARGFFSLWMNPRGVAFAFFAFLFPVSSSGRGDFS